MSSMQLSVVISGDASGASAAMNSVLGNMAKVEKGGKEMAKGGNAATDAMKFLNGALGAVGVTLSVLSIATTVADLYELGAASHAASAGLEAMTGQTASAPKYIEAIQTATHGTVSELEAAQIAQSAVGLGFVKTADEAAEFTRVAAILGKTFRGLGAKDAAQELGLLLSNMSVLRLDTFGISASKVRARIDELQASTAGMTREQAFMQAFWEQAGPKADALEGQLDSQRSSVDKLTSAWNDLTTSMGEFAADALQPAVDGATTIVDGLNRVNDAITEQKSRVAMTSSTFEDYQNGLRKSNIGVATSTAGIAAQRIEYNKLRQEGFQLTYQLTQEALAANDARVAEAEHTRMIETATGKLAEAKKAVEDYAVAQQKQAEIQLGFLGNIDQLTGANAGLASVFQAGAGALSGYNLNATDTLRLYSELGVATGELTTLQIAQSSAMTGLTNLWVTGKIGPEEYARAMHDVQTATNDAAAAAIPMQTAIDTLSQKLADGQITSGEYMRALQELPAAVEGTPETMDSLKAKVAELNDIVANMPTPDKVMFSSNAAETTTAFNDILAAQQAVDSFEVQPITFPNTAPEATTQVQDLMASIMSLPEFTPIEIQVNVTGDQVPEFAGGTSNYPGGLALVGEQGPELVVLPKHSQIKDAQTTANLLSGSSDGSSGGDSPININAPVTINAPNGATFQQLMKQFAKK